MRRRIEKVVETIVSDDFASHTDCVEMSGEKVSCVVKYGGAKGALLLELKIVFPMIRTHPDVTELSYTVHVKGGMRRT